MSTVAIGGGHGKIALLLGKLLTERGDIVRGLIRNPDQQGDLDAIDVVPVICDLESAPEDEVVAAIRDADAIVFAAGAGPGSGSARKESMDLGGAVKLIEAAKAEGISRYLIVSAMGAEDAPAEDSDGDDDGFGAYLRAKAGADDALRASGLDYTVVRPGGLTDDPGTGLVQIAERLDSGKVPRADVAAVLAACLEEPATIGRSFDLLGGETPIAEALGS